MTAGRRTLVGGLAAAFPDIDVLASYLSPLSYLYYHRGITHSLPLLPLWALLLAAIFALIWRRKPGWRAYFGVCALGLATHIAGDLITAFGTMIFAPFSDARYALSATFIIDLWFTGIIVAALLGCAIWRRSGIPARAGVAVLVAYVGMQVVLQHRATEFGESFAATQQIRDARVSAIPRPVSPFNWTVVVANGDRFHYTHINLVRERVRDTNAAAGFIARLNAPYLPLHAAEWMVADRYGSAADEIALARDAFTHPAFGFYRWFAAFPVLLRVDAGGADRCVWFHDLRFLTPGRDGTPFRYGMCRQDGGSWTPYQLIGSARALVH